MENDTDRNSACFSKDSVEILTLYQRGNVVAPEISNKTSMQLQGNFAV